MAVLHLILAFTPGVALLAILLYFDSFKLVSWRALFFSLLAGGCVAIIIAVSLLLLQTIAGSSFTNDSWSRFLAPVIEESGKGLVLVVLLLRTRIGFVVDAAIHGAAVGIGFALIENILYMSVLDSADAAVWSDPWLWHRYHACHYHRHFCDSCQTYVGELRIAHWASSARPCNGYPDSFCVQSFPAAPGSYDRHSMGAVATGILWGFSLW